MRTMVAAVAAVAVTSLVGSALVAPATATVERKGSKVTLKAVPKDSKVGKKLTLKGKSAGAKSVVKIQRKYDGSGWKTVDRTTSNKKRKYSTKVKLTQGGTTKFRAKDGKKKSQVRTLDVYQWLDLTEQPQYTLGVSFLNESARIDGRRFATSMQSLFGQTLVALDGRCSKAQGYTGFRDQDLGLLGPDDTQSLQWGDINGGEPPVQTTSAGPAVRRTLDVSGIDLFGIVLQVAQADTSDGQARALLASPRVLCNADRLEPAGDPGLGIPLRTTSKRLFR